MIKPPVQPSNSFRIELELASRQRIDSVLLAELRKQDRNPDLKNISRAGLKKLFKKRRIQLKGQSAVPSSELAAGISFVDILNYPETPAAPTAEEA